MSAHGLIERKGKDQIASRTSIKSVGEAQNESGRREGDIPYSPLLL